ncbi:MAG: hypothetical protein IJ310_01140 [Clostridia bacterium]|nr:hypothetical protein [Clostridia bacterium]
MKKIFSIFVVLLIFLTSGCSKTTNVSNATNLEDVVAYELEQIDNSQNLDDETLKSLSVVIRTNTILNNDFQDKNYNPSKKYKDIVNETKNQTLKINGNAEFIDISTQDYEWKKSIKKNKLLEFAYLNNISLSNLSNIEPIYKEEKIEKLNIAGNSFDYKNLAENFYLESNDITNIETTNKEVVIYGKNKGFYNKFDYNKSKNLSKQGKNYKEILNNLYPNFEIN